jgi:hypothetical protein
MQQIPPDPSGPMREFVDASAGLYFTDLCLSPSALFTVLLVECVVFVEGMKFFLNSTYSSAPVCVVNTLHDLPQVR